MKSPVFKLNVFKWHGCFLFYWWAKKTVLYVEFESAERYTRLLQNTCSFPMDNCSRQLHVNFGYISLSVVKCTVYSYCKFCTKIELLALTISIILFIEKWILKTESHTLLWLLIQSILYHYILTGCLLLRHSSYTHCYVRFQWYTYSYAYRALLQNDFI